MTIDKSLKLAVERTRDDLGPTGSNYPDVRRLLEFAEAAIAAEKEAQPFDRTTAIALLSAASRSGAPGAIALAAQLAGAAPCDACGFIRHACRCEKEAQQPFGSFVERSDGTTEFRRAGEPHSPTALAYKCWWLYTAPQHHCEQPLNKVSPADVPLPEPYDHIHEWDTPLYVESDLDSAPKNGRPPNRSIPVFTTKQFLLGRDAYAAAKVAAERERIKSAVTRLTLLAENCEGDGPEVDTARKSLAFKILAAIAGYEAPPQVGAQYGLFEAGKKGTT